MVYFLHIGYDGGNFHGWQFQPGLTTIQGTLEALLERVLKKRTIVYGCGRTDTGVHASQYVFHIETNEACRQDLKFILNKQLPDDIVVYDIWEMEDGMHARYDAVSRTYDYFIHLQKDPLLHHCSSYYSITDLNIEAMHSAVSILSKYRDFKTVCKQAHLYKHTICNVAEAKLFYNEEQGRIRFSITSDRFMRGMIRLIVSVLIKIGGGKMTVEQFEDRLSNQEELSEKSTALPNGLYLSKIEYPYLKIPQRNDICSFLKQGLV